MARNHARLARGRRSLREINCQVEMATVALCTQTYITCLATSTCWLSLLASCQIFCRKANLQDVAQYADERSRLWAGQSVTRPREEV